MKMPIEYNKWRQKILLLNGNKLIVKSFIFPKITITIVGFEIKNKVNEIIQKSN